MPRGVAARIFDDVRKRPYFRGIPAHAAPGWLDEQLLRAQVTDGGAETLHRVGDLGLAVGR